MQRDVPEPALLARGLDHDGRPFVAARVAVGTFPVGPDRTLVEHGVPDAQPQPVLDQPDLPAGIDHDLGAHLALGAILAFDPHADGAVALEQHVEHAHALVHLHAVLARVVEHHLVELAAHHLPGLRALVRLVVPEVERRRQLAARVDELDAVLLDEVALLHLRQHVQALQHPVGFAGSAIRRCGSAGNARARRAAPCSPAGRSAWTRGPAGPAADHHHVGIAGPIACRSSSSSRPPARSAAPSSRIAADCPARPPRTGTESERLEEPLRQPRRERGRRRAPGAGSISRRQRSAPWLRETVERNSTISGKQRTTDSMAAGKTLTPRMLIMSSARARIPPSRRAQVRPQAQGVGAPHDHVAGAVANHRAGGATQIRDDQLATLAVGHGRQRLRDPAPRTGTRPR